ncbi:MAG TPA: EAL domain-containing protein [Solirubrobacterales bacterium]|nr:EAL domain-containing protein [Solirubrobacterales bacterium]
MRARRTAASTRVVLGLLGIALIALQPSLLATPALGIAGFAAILLTSLIQLYSSRVALLRVEESLAGVAAILIVGLGDQQVNVLSVIWLVAVATGVMARGGRVHWIGRTVVLAALALPVLRLGELSAAYAAFCVGVIGLQLTSGRLTRELNRLLRQARLEAESAETLLYAGDIAARLGDGVGAPRPPLPEPDQRPLSATEEANARGALERLVAGEGMAMAVQPIVDVASGRVHAYEALARFERRRSDRSPLHWLALAEELGERGPLERACLRAALELFGRRPGGALLSVNLSLPVLLEEETLEMLRHLARGRGGGLDGLIVELTEETLVSSHVDFETTLADLRALGAQIAVDDVGAGYSGLRQITAVVPDYLKLDRALVAGIDRDPDRAALVGALTGYAAQVGSKLVAEGIEHEEELECLRGLEVPLGQGFHLGVPGKPWPLQGDKSYGQTTKIDDPVDRVVLSL